MKEQKKRLDDYGALAADVFLRAIIYYRTNPPRHKWRLLVARSHQLKKRAMDDFQLGSDGVSLY